MRNARPSGGYQAYRERLNNPPVLGSLFFSGTSVVDFGSATVLDNIFTTKGTAILIAYRDTWAAFTGGNLLRKNAANTFQFTWGAGATPNIQVLLDRATTDLRIDSTSTAMPVIAANKWVFMAAVWDSTGANGDQHLYAGDLTTPFIEASSYTLQQVGSGTITDTSALPLLVGNTSGGGVPEPGKIAFVGVWPNPMTLTQLRAQQQQLTPIDNCGLFSWLGGGGLQLDYSGYKNHGTLTGTTPWAGPPAHLIGQRGLVSR